MPSRSTLLQRVVFHVERQLAAGTSVRESVMLPERSSNREREVDVVIQGQLGSHDVFVCIECQDRSRKATVEWVEQMAMKHSLLPTSKLILVAVQGFTSTAIEKAASFGIDTYSLDEALAADWKELLGDPFALDVYAFRILDCVLVMADEAATQIRAGRSVNIFNEDGSLRCLLGELVDRTTATTGFTEGAIDFGAKDGPSAFGAELKFKSALVIKDSDGISHQVRFVRVYFEMHPAEAPEHFTTARYRGRHIAYTKGQVPIGDFALTMVKSPTDSPSGAVTVTNPATGNAKTVDIHFGSPEGKVLFVTDIIRTGDIKE
jgi:hypothetical protein